MRPRLTDTFDGYIDFAKSWGEFHRMYWHLLDDERRDSYLLDMRDGILPPEHERDTDIDQYPEAAPEDTELTERTESRMIFWDKPKPILWTDPDRRPFVAMDFGSKDGDCTSILAGYRMRDGMVEITSARTYPETNDHAADAMRYAMMAWQEKPEPKPTLWQRLISFLSRLMRCVHVHPCKNPEDCDMVIDRPACPHCGSRHTQAHSGMENEEEGCPKWACVDCHQDFVLSPAR